MDCEELNEILKDIKKAGEKLEKEKYKTIDINNDITDCISILEDALDGNLRLEKQLTELADKIREIDPIFTNEERATLISKNIYDSLKGNWIVTDVLTKLHDELEMEIV